jgi:hypothetical protein
MKAEILKSDLIGLKLSEMHDLKSLYLNSKQFSKAEDVQDKINTFKAFTRYATDKMLLEELKTRLTDFYQVLAGYYYTIAEDFEFNPLIKVDRLRKAVFYCQMLKKHEPKADIYKNKYICQRNRNYLN